jgi:hypothetical protein
MHLKKTAIVFLLLLLSSPFCVNIQVVHAQDRTLAEVINKVASNIQTKSSSGNVIYDQIFCRQNRSVFDNAITQALEGGDLCSVIFIARLAELNAYSSEIINSSVRRVLQTIPLVGSLPKTYSQTIYAPDSFLLNDRYMINAYHYAQQLNVSGWDINQAFSDVANIYYHILQTNSSRDGISNSQYGEMLFVNPELNRLVSSNSRYYDEHAQTIALFLEFALKNASDIKIDGLSLNTTAFADDAWLCTQSHWNNGIYGYVTNNGVSECEMGNFAEILSEYQNFRGSLPYFDRVITDLENKLLVNGFGSRGWGTTGVIKHEDDNPQLRLQETLSAAIALQTFYSSFSSNSQAIFQDMQQYMGQGLINSNLYDSETNQFRLFFQEEDELGYGNSTSDDASLMGAMTLFLNSIIPQTGYLTINASEEKFNDYRTCFPVAEWRFDYANRMVRIPVAAGNLAFIFGSQLIDQNFDSNGVFDVCFADDWNSILSINKVANISIVFLSPVLLETIPRSYEITKTTPTSTPNPSFNPIPSPTQSSPVNLSTPAPSPSQTVETTPTITSHSETPIKKYDITLYISVMVGVSGLLGFTVLYHISVRRKNRIH